MHCQLWRVVRFISPGKRLSEIIQKGKEFSSFKELEAAINELQNVYHHPDRAVAASPIGPVSTGPLFSSIMACLASPIISAIARQTPTQCQQAHRYHFETCEMAANIATEASPVKGVAFGR